MAKQKSREAGSGSAGKTKKSFYYGFDKVWFKNDTEYLIFLVWGMFVSLFLMQLTGN